MKTKLITIENYLLLIDEKAEIKENDWFLSLSHKVGDDEFSFITNDEIAQRLISKRNTEIFEGWINGVIDDDFQKLQGNYDVNFCKKIIAYYPLTKEAKELDLPLLPNPFKAVDVEELANIATDNLGYESEEGGEYKNGWEDGYKAAQSDKQFSLEDVENILVKYLEEGYISNEQGYINPKKFLQSLSTQQLPKEFIPEFEYYYHSSKDFYIDAKFEKCSKEQYKSIKEVIPTCPVKVELKTITNSEGKQELVGTYKY